MVCYCITSFSAHAVVSILKWLLFSFICSDSDLDLGIAAPELLALMKYRLPRYV